MPGAAANPLRETTLPALLLAGVSLADLFGGYAFNIALSRRIFDIGGAGPAS